MWYQITWATLRSLYRYSDSSCDNATWCALKLTTHACDWQACHHFYVTRNLVLYDAFLQAPQSSGGKPIRWWDWRSHIAVCSHRRTGNFRPRENLSNMKSRGALFSDNSSSRLLLLQSTNLYPVILRSRFVKTKKRQRHSQFCEEEHERIPDLQEVVLMCYSACLFFIFVIHRRCQQLMVWWYVDGAAGDETLIS